MRVRFPMSNGLKSRLPGINNSYRYLLLALSVVVLCAFLVAGNGLVKELAAQEREKMDIWSEATQRLSRAETESDVDFLLSIIEKNNSIPVLIANGNGEILDFRNFKLPVEEDKENPAIENLSPRNLEFLNQTLKEAMGHADLETLSGSNPHFIKVNLYYNLPQYIYYEDSHLLKTLSWYPYIQLVVVAIITAMIYFGMIYTKKAEQNRLWAALSKETAHQLGTPISSLVAWNELLKDSGVNPEIPEEMNKDIRRLSEIADRFSKIGSSPELENISLNETIKNSAEYMKSRISDKVKVTVNLDPRLGNISHSPQLIQWVVENLMKNAVDAMNGKGEIRVMTGKDKINAWIEISDTGKGIDRRNFKKIFTPGYTTKKRGWGLGLTLAKRIINEYQGGRIYVKESTLGKGTTFRIEIPV